jgi:hypothetical protein
VDAATERANAAIDRAARDRNSTIYVNPVVQKNQQLYDLTGHYATGGPVVGPGSATSDSVPTMLSNGEYVINAAAANKFRSVLDQINYGAARRYATGGQVTAGSARFEGTTVRTQAANQSTYIQTVELSAYDRHLLTAIADSTGVVIPSGPIAKATSTGNSRQVRRGNG